MLRVWVHVGQLGGFGKGINWNEIAKAGSTSEEALLSREPVVAIVVKPVRIHLRRLDLTTITADLMARTTIVCGIQN